MIRRPPRSTLFPYTTSSDLKGSRTVFTLPACRCASNSKCVGTGHYRRGGCLQSQCRIWGHPRSEEHTSELQSPYDLVCRLLLEKKKKKKTTNKCKCIYSEH